MRTEEARQTEAVKQTPRHGIVHGVGGSSLVLLGHKDGRSKRGLFHGAVR